MITGGRKRGLAAVSLGPVICLSRKPTSYLLAPIGKARSDSHTSYAAIVNRLAKQVGPEESLHERDFLRHMKKKAKELRSKAIANLDDAANPFNTWSLQEAEQWIMGLTHTPLWRKEELLERHKEIQLGSENHWNDTQVKMFIKWEVYQELEKRARCINPRSDRYKVRTGPVAAALDWIIMKNNQDWFLKYTPHVLRPQVLVDKFSGRTGRYCVSDFSSFECSFRQRNLGWEIECFRVMLEGVEGAKEALDYYEEWAIDKLNRIVGPGVKAKVPGSRMSGEQFTSCANGFMNFCLITYFSEKHNSEPLGVVEGDDGLFLLDNPNTALMEHLANDLGFKLKIQTFDDLGEASFCGCLFASGSEHNFEPFGEGKHYDVITDAIWHIVKAPFAHPSFKKAYRTHKRLLRAKAMSLAYTFHGCPILWKWCEVILRATSGVNLGNLYLGKAFNQYERERFSWIQEHFDWKFSHEPHESTRVLYEKLYGISIANQKLIESEISRWSGGVMCLPSLNTMHSGEDFVIKQDWITNGSRLQGDSWPVQQDLVDDHSLYGIGYPRSPT